MQATPAGTCSNKCKYSSTRTSTVYCTTYKEEKNQTVQVINQKQYLPTMEQSFRLGIGSFRLGKKSFRLCHESFRLGNKVSDFETKFQTWRRHFQTLQQFFRLKTNSIHFFRLNDSDFGFQHFCPDLPIKTLVFSKKIKT